MQIGSGILELRVVKHIGLALFPRFRPILYNG